MPAEPHVQGAEDDIFITETPRRPVRATGIKLAMPVIEEEMSKCTLI